MKNSSATTRPYFELYGRTVNLVTFEGTGGATDDVAARADAARIAEEYKPFVVLGGPALTSAFADELAAREIMCIGCTPGNRRSSTWTAIRTCGASMAVRLRSRRTSSSS